MYQVYIYTVYLNLNKCTILSCVGEYLGYARFNDLFTSVILIYVRC